jgi:vacuolar protein sorting-associated protein 53
MEVMIAQSLTARVDAAIKKVLGGATDDFDAPEFSAEEWVNRRFPDEKSLEGLDACIASTDLEVKQLDESILETVREQSTAGQLAARDIADAKGSIGDLHEKILEIKRKADASEKMVQEICRDIRQLDVAKRHLTNTINTLARLKTLSSAVEQLAGHSRRRAYEEAAPLLEASILMFTHFTDYRDVPKVSRHPDLEGEGDLARCLLSQVSEMATSVEKIRQQLK